MNDDRLGSLQRAVTAFRDARDWRQFHSLRNLIVSLNLEAAELLELTQWQSDAEVDAIPGDPAMRQKLEDECADVLLYLLLVAERSGIDLATAARDKLARNEVRYPVAQAFGSRRKYDQLES